MQSKTWGEDETKEKKNKVKLENELKSQVSHHFFVFLIMCNLWNKWQLWKKAKSKKLLVIWGMKGEGMNYEYIWKGGFEKQFCEWERGCIKRRGFVNIKGGWAYFLTSREVKFCDHLKKIRFFYEHQEVGICGEHWKRLCIWMKLQGWLVSIDKHLEGIGSCIG